MGYNYTKSFDNLFHKMLKKSRERIISDYFFRSQLAKNETRHSYKFKLNINICHFYSLIFS